MAVMMDLDQNLFPSTASHVGRACNDCKKLKADSNVLRIHILHIMKGSHINIFVNC